MPFQRSFWFMNRHWYAMSDLILYCLRQSYLSSTYQSHDKCRVTGSWTHAWHPTFHKSIAQQVKMIAWRRLRTWILYSLQWELQNVCVTPENWRHQLLRSANEAVVIIFSTGIVTHVRDILETKLAVYESTPKKIKKLPISFSERLTNSLNHINRFVSLV